jgi:hypothetical protein
MYCRECFKKYLINKKEDAHCMSCKNVYSREFLNDNLDKTFINNDYRDLRQEILLEKEMSLLQVTQPIVEEQIRVENVKKELKLLESIFLKKKAELIHKLQSPSHEIKEKKKFIRKCPKNDCLGFLSSSLKCGICETYSCKDCREIKNENHQCNPEILENIILLEKDSKNCPKCSSLIFKIDGCDLMFCVECQTHWDWITGLIKTKGNLHNPHYIEFLARKGQLERDPADIICGREIDRFFLSRLTNLLLSKIDKNIWKTVAGRNYDIRDPIVSYKNIITNKIQNKPPFTKEQDIILEIARNVNDIRDQINNYNIDDTDNLNLRIRYMRNRLSATRFKTILQKNEKLNEKNKEMSNILNMYINCITDLLYRFIEKDLQETQLLIEAEELRKYTNTHLEKVSKDFNQMSKQIRDNYRFI